MSAWATIWKRPSFQRKFTLVVSGLTAFYCVLEADYTDAAGKEHCFTWVQAYYRKEVVAPAAAAKAWVKARWKPSSKPARPVAASMTCSTFARGSTSSVSTSA